jgi:hypothetical protein
MPYLIAKDFTKQIQSDNLSQIIGGDNTVLLAAEYTAMEEAKSYLVQKYKVDQEFQELIQWDPTPAYNPADRVFLNASAYNQTSTYSIGALTLNGGNVYRCNTAITVAESFNASKWDLLGSQYAIFYAKYPQPLFDYNKQYAVGDQVYWNGHTYRCLTATLPLSQSGLLQFGKYESVPLLNVAPDNVDNGAQYWFDNGAFVVPASTIITNDVYWAAADNRSQQLLTYIIDIALYHLHSRISPRNIPDLRVKRYDDARAWLKAVARGEVTANLPAIQPASGSRIRYGGNIKNVNTY